MHGLKIIWILLISVSAAFGQNSKSEVNALKLNQELLDSCLIEAINQKRAELDKEPFLVRKELNQLAKNYQKEFESRRFTNSDRYERRIDKYVMDKLFNTDYEGTMVQSKVVSDQLIDYNGKKFYFDRKDKSTQLHLFYGERGDDQLKAIENYTYESLAEYLTDQLFSKREYRKAFRSNAFKDIGVSCKLDYKSLYRTTIPQVKVIFILGGSQTDLLKESL